jgi:hypothetical protein
MRLAFLNAPHLPWMFSTAATGDGIPKSSVKMSHVSSSIWYIVKFSSSPPLPPPPMRPPPLKETTERDKEIAVLSPCNVTFCAQWGEHHLGAGRSLDRESWKEYA